MKIVTSLRMGLLIDSWTVPQWVYRVIVGCPRSRIIYG